MTLRIVTEPIPKAGLETMAAGSFGDMVKVVVDVSRRVMAVGGEMHADEETLLIENGSAQEDLWGANIYPALPKESRIVYLV